VKFEGADGHQLAGRLHLPDAPARGSILLAHCFTCSKDQRTTARLAKALQDAGYAVLRFDFTGLGDSEGAFADTTIATNVRDVVSAAAELIRRGYGPCGRLGHSLGGAAILLAAPKIHTARSIATLGTPATAGHVRRLLGADAQESLRRDGRAAITVGGRPFEVSGSFLEDLEAAGDEPPVRDLGRPYCIVHAVDDEVVSVEQGERLFAAARQPKQFVPLQGADHLLTEDRHIDQVAAVLVEWFDRTLSPD
jgi:alpha-beta hydrolase superfamily lysophospholipase